MFVTVVERAFSLGGAVGVGVAVWGRVVLDVGASPGVTVGVLAAISGLAGSQLSSKFRISSWRSKFKSSDAVGAMSTAA